MPYTKPPEKIPHKHEAHGHERLDDYHWMRERDAEPVLEYLKRENARAAKALESVVGLEGDLYREMRSRIKEEDSSVPHYHAPYYYYSRYEKGLEYAIYCRKNGSLDAPEEIVFNVNEHAKGHDYYQVADLDPSPDHRFLAVAVDTVGRRIFDIIFVDLQSGKVLEEKIKIATPSLAWAKDSQTLFFARQDLETLRSCQIFRYKIGSKQEPSLVYDEPDTTFNVYVSASKTGQFLFLTIHKRDSSEVRILNADQPEGQWRVFSPRELHHEYSIADGGDRFFVLTNWQAENFRLMEVSLEAKDKSAWREVLPASHHHFRDEMEVYEKFVVVSERYQGLSRLRVMDRKTGHVRELSFPDEAYEMGLSTLPDYQTTYLRFAYDSMVQPPSVYDEDMATGQRTLRKVRDVPGFHAENYETKRLWATAPDGTRVPMSVAFKKGIALNGENPCLLYGYGSYGIINTAHFSSAFFSLIDRGFVLVRAHIRGGSEMGRDWYEKGRLKHKMNSFTDFISCAEELIQAKYTSPDHLHIMGGSAGGLLMGAVMNMRPELFNSVSAGVPFVDVLTTMLDESIPLTTGEYREWGDPRIPEQYEWMKQYSPYDNIREQNYPHLLVTTGYHDSQVQYWEPAKWVAKLREYKTDQNLLLLHTNFEAGHSGASGRFEALKLLAKEFAFILMVEKMGRNGGK